MNSETLKLKKQVKDFFKQHPEINCPAFPGEKVFFNSKGMSHLFYKDLKKTSSRNLKEVKTRVKLLPRAVKVLSLMPLIQEEREIERQKKIHYYYAFEAIVDGLRIKVIVKQVGNGQKHFWSVIPSWRRYQSKIFNAKSKNLEK